MVISRCQGTKCQFRPLQKAEVVIMIAVVIEEMDGSD